MVSNIKSWSTTPGSNNATPPDGAPEGMAPSSVNDCIRQNMAEIRKWWEVPEWIDFGHTPVFVDGDTLRVSGDKTATYTVNRRIRVTGTTPFTIYGTITAVAYNAPNTDIEITFDSGSIDSTVNTMAVGAEVTNKAIGSDAIKYRNGSIPEAAVNLTPFTIFTGCMVDYAGLTAPSGWLLCSGLTIGNASSSATGRANADTSDLFTLLWNSFADAELPVSGGRGANAAADYAANKTITLPDLRGRVTAGQDDMGGTSANRITTIDGDVMGMTGGAETHTLDITQIPAHTHDITAQTLRSFAGGSATVASTTTNTTFPSTSAGGGAAHNNLQPMFIINKIIKL